MLNIFYHSIALLASVAAAYVLALVAGVQLDNLIRVTIVAAAVRTAIYLGFNRGLRTIVRQKYGLELIAPGDLFVLAALSIPVGFCSPSAWSDQIGPWIIFGGMGLALIYSISHAHGFQLGADNAEYFRFSANLRITDISLILTALIIGVLLEWVRPWPFESAKDYALFFTVQAIFLIVYSATKFGAFVGCVGIPVESERVYTAIPLRPLAYESLFYLALGLGTRFFVMMDWVDLLYFVYGLAVLLVLSFLSGWQINKL